MTRTLALLLLSAVLVGCKQEVPVTETADAREPVAIRYVGAPELPVREQPSDTAAVITTYQNGESVSVLADKGEWVEVRTGDRAGWAKAADLTTAELKEQFEDNPDPKFRIMPMPVSAPSARGEVYIEADVNTEGEVTGVRVITNTTNSAALGEQNAAALRGAKFHPIIIKNERKPFKYYYKVTY